MASKKYILMVALIVLLQSVGLAQTDWGWDWKDTSKIAVKFLPQHNEFLNNQYPYPAKPRSQWELGLQVGRSQIFGDVVNHGWNTGGAITFRKALGHLVSVRFGLQYHKAEGIDTKLWSTDRVDGYMSPTLGYRGFTSYGVYTAYNPANPNAALRAFVPNYRTRTAAGTVDFVFSLNALDFYRGNPKWDWYLFGGYSMVNSDVDTRLALGGNGATPFNFTTVNFNQPRHDIQGAVDNIISAPNTGGSKENYTNAPVRRKRDDLTTGNFLLNHALTYGGGFSYKLSDRINIGFEERLTNTFSGDLDAVNTGSNDILAFASAHLNINLGNKAKAVQPLWWLNPLNYAYSELNVPRHMKLPRVVLPDGDGDGVTDQFDLEPNTPRGCPVDTHGVSKDTDGDGVPDCRDKEVLTQLKCFPVNSDGVGTCPEPACCKEIRDLLAQRPVEPTAQCVIGGLPSVQFAARSAKLTRAAENVLASAAASIKANPNCNIRVIGYGAASKAAQQMSWERVNAVIKYLTERQGISESRLLFQYGQDGDANTVDLQGTMETGPTMVPAPHPNLRRN